MKKLLVSLAAIVAVVATASQVSAAKKDPKPEPSSQYEYFCHRTNSVKNPYVKKPFSATFKEVDGKGHNDHSQHTGDVVSTKAEAKALKADHIKWGDIIPPVDPYLPDGYNWTTKGQAVYNNNCNYPATSETASDIEYTVNCNVTNTGIVVTLTNSGDASGKVTVNGEEITVAAGAEVTREYGDGTTITITLEGESEPVYNQQVKCQVGGSGGGSTETPGTVTTATLANAQLPSTSGVNYAVLLGSISAAAIALSLGGKRLFTRFS